jgi:hypothetical protein
MEVATVKLALASQPQFTHHCRTFPLLPPLYRSFLPRLDLL